MKDTKYPITADRASNRGHNLLYWNRGEYYGFGCSAAGFTGNERYSDIRDVREYIELNGDIGKLHENIEILTKEDAMEEFMFLGLRKVARS